MHRHYRIAIAAFVVGVTAVVGGLALKRLTAPEEVHAQQLYNLPATRPYIPMPYHVDTSTEAYTRFKAGVDKALSGTYYYAFSAIDPAIMYRVTGDQRYATLAITRMDNYVKSEEAKIAAGQSPAVAADSYLYAGTNIPQVMIVYDWMYDLLTPDQRSRWEAFTEQTIYNIWNPSLASWGGQRMTWSGWSIDNPGNNYHYSFLTATMHWAIASKSQTWLDFLNNNKLPKVVTYFNTMQGGGSKEGLGYGQTHAELFALYALWKDATGNDLSIQNTHAKDSIEYWIHATLPNLTRHAPIGDLARDSSATIYDYYRKIILEAIPLNKNTVEARHGNWFLKNIPLNKMKDNFNFRWDFLYEKDIPEEKPTALVYYASAVGNLFARTSWNTDATWFSYIAGPYYESHAHQDQGSFMLYKNKWLAIDEVIGSYSGIVQSTLVHNLVNFRKNGTSLAQRIGKKASMSYTDTNGVLKIDSDLSPMFLATDVASWKRDVTFDRNQNTVQIHDLFTPGAGVTGTWQINVPVLPVVTGNTIMAGDLTITVVEPANPTITVIDWKTVNASEFGNGWRVDVSGATSEYTVNLTMPGSGGGGTPVPTPEPTNNLPVITTEKTSYDVRLGETLLIPMQVTDADGEAVTVTIPNLSQLLPGATFQ